MALEPVCSLAVRMGSEREGSVKLDADVHFPGQGSTTNEAGEEIMTGVLS